jgi:hypothetical protein
MLELSRECCSCVQVGDGESDGERERSCIGGGDTLPEMGVEGLRGDRAEKSCANWCSSETEFEDLADVGKSSTEVRNDDVDVTRLISNRLGLVRSPDGPGSLSPVANDIMDILGLCKSDDDIE